MTLSAMSFCDGNVSAFEMLVIASLVADNAPDCIVEIGTFNGNTTMQMARNAPDDAELFTLDLPLDELSTTSVVDAQDVKYIQSSARAKRKYAGTPTAKKIREVFADTAQVDFQAILGARKIDFAFIDGSHSYDYVQNDTVKILAHLAPGAVVLWHDYESYWHGVCRYLNELQATRQLLRIDGTTFVFYRHPLADDASPAEGTATFHPST